MAPPLAEIYRQYLADIPVGFYRWFASNDIDGLFSVWRDDENAFGGGPNEVEYMTLDQMRDVLLGTDGLITVGEPHMMEDPDEDEVVDVPPFQVPAVGPPVNEELDVPPQDSLMWRFIEGRGPVVEEID